MHDSQKMHESFDIEGASFDMVVCATNSFRAEGRGGRDHHMPLGSVGSKFKTYVSMICEQEMYFSVGCKHAFFFERSRRPAKAPLLFSGF